MNPTWMFSQPSLRAFTAGPVFTRARCQRAKYFRNRVWPTAPVSTTPPASAWPCSVTRICSHKPSRRPMRHGRRWKWWRSPIRETPSTPGFRRTAYVPSSFDSTGTYMGVAAVAAALAALSAQPCATEDALQLRLVDRRIRIHRSEHAVGLKQHRQPFAIESAQGRDPKTRHLLRYGGLRTGKSGLHEDSGGLHEDSEWQESGTSPSPTRSSRPSR